MASQDVAILAASTAAAPLAYTVPNAQEIMPLAVTAEFDGTGAASAYLPTVEIVNPGGVVIARVPTATSVAAGASAEVTFAPFLRGEQAQTAAAGTQVAYYTSFPPDHTVRVQTFQFGLDGTSDAANFSLLGTDARLQPGVYTCWAQINIGHDQVFTTAGTDYVRGYVNFPGGFPHYTAGTQDLKLPFDATMNLLVNELKWQVQFVATAATSVNVVLDANNLPFAVSDVEMYFERLMDAGAWI